MEKLKLLWQGIKELATKIFAKIGILAKDPDVLVVVGCCAIVAATAMTIYATVKTIKLLELYSDEVDNLKNTMVIETTEDELDQDFLEKKKKIRNRIFWRIVRVWTPVLVLIVFAIGSVIYSHTILVSKNAVLGAAVTSLTEQLADAETRAKEAYGEVEGNRIIHGGEVKTDENGNPYNVYGKTPDTLGFFTIGEGDIDSWGPFSNRAEVLSELRNQLEYAKYARKADTNGIISLNDALFFIDSHLKTAAGQIYGFGPESDIDWGINDLLYPEKYGYERYNRFVKGIDNTITFAPVNVVKILDYLPA